jgi:hypothetical protein
MITTHQVYEIKFDKDKMYLMIDGESIVIDLAKVSPKLKFAEDFQRAIYKVSPSGYGIHWPLIDEDLAVESLIKTSKL